MRKQLVAMNFKLALIILLIWIPYSLNTDSIANIGSPELIVYLHTRFLIWWVCILVVSILAWIIYYKDEEGQRIAFAIGLVLLIPVSAALISGLIHDTDFIGINFVLLSYLGISHFAYAFTDLGHLADS